jgi:hypothetical protein
MKYQIGIRIFNNHTQALCLYENISVSNNACSLLTGMFVVPENITARRTAVVHPALKT